MELLKEYVIKFGDVPPLIQTMDYNDEFYQSLIKEAIEENQEITNDVINVKLKGQEFDLIVDDEALSARAYAEKYSE